MILHYEWFVTALHYDSIPQPLDRIEWDLNLVSIGSYVIVFDFYLMI